jgi:hypothetical protein
MHCSTQYARGRNFREEIARILARHGRTAARIVPSDPLDLPQLVALIRSCHAFVLPTRGEGWGLPILEAMACELPCIITDYSGSRNSPTRTMPNSSASSACLKWRIPISSAPIPTGACGRSLDLGYGSGEGCSSHRGIAIGGMPK